MVTQADGALLALTGVVVLLALIVDYRSRPPRRLPARISSARGAGGSSYRLCHPHVVVMKAAQERYWNDTADGLNGPAHRRVLSKGEVCANPIIVDGISRQDPAQMRLAEHHDMVEALTPDRADEAFNMAVLPRRAGRGGSVPDTHRLEPLRDDGAIAAIPIADEVSRCLIPWESCGG